MAVDDQYPHVARAFITLLTSSSYGERPERWKGSMSEPEVGRSHRLARRAICRSRSQFISSNHCCARSTADRSEKPQISLPPWAVGIEPANSVLRSTADEHSMFYHAVRMARTQCIVAK